MDLICTRGDSAVSGAVQKESSVSARSRWRRRGCRCPTRPWRTLRWATDVFLSSLPVAAVGKLDPMSDLRSLSGFV